MATIQPDLSYFERRSEALELEVSEPSSPSPEAATTNPAFPNAALALFGTTNPVVQAVLDARFSVAFQTSAEDVTSKDREVSKIVYYSPSQIKTFVDCNRMWWWERIGKYRRPKTPAQLIGIGIHKELETFIKTDAPPPDKRALEAIRHIDLSRRNYLRSEGRIQFPLDIPNRTFTGYIDLLDIDPDQPEIADFKTMKDLRWAKNGFELAEDVQMISYANAAIDLIPVPSCRQIKLRHIQIQSIGTVRSASVDTIVDRDHVRRKWDSYLKIIDNIEAVRTRDIENVEPRRTMCSAYGGCYHLERCNMIDMGIPVPVPNPDYVPEKRDDSDDDVEENVIINPPDSTRRPEGSPPATVDNVAPEDVPKVIVAARKKAAAEESKAAREREKAEKKAAKENKKKMTTPSATDLAALAAQGSNGPLKVDRPALTPANAFLAGLGATQGAAPAATTPPPVVTPPATTASATPPPVTGTPNAAAFLAGLGMNAAAAAVTPPATTTTPPAPPAVSAGSADAAKADLLKQLLAKQASAAAAAASSSPVPTQPPPVKTEVSPETARALGSDPLVKEGAAATVPAGEAAGTPETATEAEKKKRGRPSNADVLEQKTKQLEEAQVALAAAQAEIVKFGEAHTRSVEDWTKEKVALTAQVQAAAEANAQAVQAATQLASEKKQLEALAIDLNGKLEQSQAQLAAALEAVSKAHADSISRSHETATALVAQGPVLYLDCMPMSSVAGAVHLAHFLAPIEEEIRNTTGIPWQIHDFRKGSGLLAERVRTAPLPPALIVDGRTPAAGVVIEVLMARCTGGIIRGL